MNGTTMKPVSSVQQKRQNCDELKVAMTGSIGDIVSAHEKMILQYYADVQQQAKQSFDAAKIVAALGFIVLIATLVYIFWLVWHPKISGSITVATVGTVSGVLIEFIAAINFWLYSRASKQFGAFHICLERTHRYLIAYKITEEIKGKRDETLEKLVCIMANASMIHQGDSNTEEFNPSTNKAEAKSQLS